MKAKLQSFFRHALTGAATVGTFLGTHGLIDQADVAQTNADAAQAVPLIASIAAAVVSRILLLLAAKYAPRLGSLLGSQSSGTGVSLLAMGVTAAVLCSALPSCNPGTAFPVTGSIFYRDPKSGAKAGLAFTPGERSKAYFRVPVFDPETGEKRGEANLEIPVGKAAPEVDAKSAK
jgi:hypothetical protein